MENIGQELVSQWCWSSEGFFREVRRIAWRRQDRSQVTQLVRKGAEFVSESKRSWQPCDGQRFAERDSNDC